MKIVIDTNVLIDAMQGEHSYGAQIMRAVVDGQATAYASRPVMGEYRLIAGRQLGNPADQRLLAQFLELVEVVETRRVHGVIEDDAEDEKFLGVADAVAADVIVSSDRHLLNLRSYHDTRIVRPAELVHLLEDAGDPAGKQRWAGWFRDTFG